MNRKNLIGLIIVILMVTSGPLFIPLVLATSEPITSTNETEKSSEIFNSTNLTKPPLITYSDKLSIEAKADTESGDTPLFISFKGAVNQPHLRGGVLIYKWDFDGDGITDYASLDTGDITHVYMVNETTKIESTFTTVFQDGSSLTEKIPLTVEALKKDEWFEIKNFGLTKFGIKQNGEIVIFDEKDWLTLELTADVRPTSVKFEEVDFNIRKLQYNFGSYSVSIIITYGITGRSELVIEKYDESGNLIDLDPDILMVSKEGKKERGRLNYISNSKKLEGKNKLVVDAGNHDPWKDTGVVPYGEYFKNINEYVSTQTGYLSIVQTDVKVPGRGLDLDIKRVYAPPTTYTNYLPATTVDYSYQNYPWAPMGNGWMLGFPWIEWNANGPTYIRLSNGQRYKYENIGYGSKEYHSADHFKLIKHNNNTYTLYEVDGRKYRFDSAYKLLYIKDNDGVNLISFTYQNNKISKITDTIGREYVFQYNSNGLLSSITAGTLVWIYSYVYAISNTFNLVKITDPEERATKYTYEKNYLIKSIIYPSGGQSIYEYRKYTAGSLVRYRVLEHIVWDGVSDKHDYTNYIWSGNFDDINAVYIYDKYGNEDKRKTYVYYTQDSVLEKIWNKTTTLYRTENKMLSDERRRIDIELTPGSQTSYVAEIVQRYDEWGNLLYSKDYVGHEQYFSYANTLNSQKYVDSNGAEVYYFTNNFYTFTLSPEIRNRIIGHAEHQDGPGSNTIEEYYKYSYNGNRAETRRLESNEWLITRYEYDAYGNINKVTDANNHITEYTYSSDYMYAYITQEKKLLEKIPQNETLIKTFSYYSNTGLLQTIFDEKNNRTDYYYDDVGRLTKIVYPDVNGKRTQKIAEYIQNFSSQSFSLGEPTISTWVEQTFEAEGRIWYFYSLDGVKFCSSADDGQTWSSPTTVVSGDFDLFFDGTYVHLLNVQSTLYYIRGDPQPNGTIAWGNSNLITGVDEGPYFASIVVTDNYVWVGYSEWESGSVEKYIRYVIRSTNLNGGWTYYDRPHWSSHDTYCIYGKLYALTGDKVCYIKKTRSNWEFFVSAQIWTGSSWGKSFTIVSNMDGDKPWEAVVQGDDVFVLHPMNTTLPYTLIKYTYSTSKKTTLDSNVYIPEGYCEYHPQLINGNQTGTVYCVWNEDSRPLNILYRYWNGNELEATKYLIVDELGVSASNIHTNTQMYNDKGLVFYRKKINSIDRTCLTYLIPDDKKENIVREFNENNQKTEYIYDGLSKIIQKTRYNSSEVYSTEKYSYGWAGLPVVYIDPDNNEYQYYYDGIKHLTKTVNPDQSQSQTTYDFSNNVVTKLDEEERKVVNQYDWNERLVSVKEYYSSTQYYQTDYIYDKNGNLIKLIDSLDRETNYYYDQANRLIHIEYPDDKWEAYNYDTVGNLINMYHRNGTCIQYQYDSLNRMVNETHHLTNITKNPTLEGWLSGWGYRKSIEITGTTVGPQTNYQIMLNVYYGSGSDNSNNIYMNGKCQADFDDIRFTKSDGDTKLDYWRGYRDANSAVFWVEVDSIPASPSKATIYVYYGNSTTTSESSGPDTFIDFDDMEAYSNGATLPFGDWIAEDVDHTVQVTTDVAWEGSKSIYGYDSGSGRNIFQWNIPDKTSGSYRMHAAYYVVNYGNKYTKPLTPIQSTRIINVEYTDGAIRYYDGTWHTITTGVSTDAWHTMEICFAVGGSTFDICLDDVWYYNYNQEHRSGSTYPYSIQILNGALAYTTKAYYDAYFVGKYADPEPQISGYGVEETQPEIDYLNYYSALFSYDECSNRISSRYNHTDIYWVYDAMNRLTVETFNISGSLYSVYYEYNNYSRVTRLVYPDSSSVSYIYDALGRISDVGGVAELEYSLNDLVSDVSYSNGVETSYSYDNRSRPVHILVSKTCEGGWLSGWGKRIGFTIESDRVASDVTIPVRLTLSSAAGIGDADISAVFDELGTSYKKLAITSGDGVTEVGQVEVARWDSVGEEAELWFRVPLDADQDTQFYLYYGSGHTDNSNVKDPGDATSVWPTGTEEKYIAVYHLGEATGSLIDSTSNSFDAAIGDLESRQVDGYNGGYAVSFEPLDYLTLGDLNLEGDTLTVMTVANIESDLVDSGTFVGCWPQSDQYLLYVRNEAGGDYVRAMAYLSNGQLHTIQSSTSDITTGQWATWTNTFSKGAFFKLYKDRSIKSSLTPLNYPIRSPSPSSFTASVGAIDTDNDGYFDDVDDFDGQIDFILVARQAFTQTQIDVYTYGFEDNLVRWGGEESPPGMLLNLTYAYDKTGSITSIYDGTNTESYGYDLLDRLTSSSGPWGSLGYSYDSVGNRLSLNRGGAVTSYTYDNINRISSATGMSFTWDDNGNLLAWDDGSDDWAYRYDSENRLVNVKKNDAISARYTYDTGGRRVRSWDAVSGTTDYVYSGLNIIDEVRGGVHEKHVYAGGMHLASISSGTVEYYHVDHLGSTRLKTDASGNAIYSSNYEPYGPEYGESGSEEFRYTGKQEDPTGLYYFGARYYDPATGRFTTRDSVFGDLLDPQSLNKYVYCRNNPHKYRDPDGRLGVIAAVLLYCGIRILNAHIRGVQRQRAYSQIYPTADKQHMQQEYLIGFDTSLTSGVIAEIDVKKYTRLRTLKASRGVLSDVLEIEMENQQARLGAPGYETETQYTITDAGVEITQTIILDEAYDKLVTPLEGRIDSDILHAGKTEFRFVTQPILLAYAEEAKLHLKPIEYYYVPHGYDPWVYGR